MKLKRDKVTRDALRKIEVGQAQEFVLPNLLACESARVTAYQLKRYYDMEFENTPAVQNKRGGYSITFSRKK